MSGVRNYGCELYSLFLEKYHCEPLLPHTFHLPKTTSNTLNKTNRLLGIRKKNILSSTYHKMYKGNMPSIHTAITP
jgi:hypothetical protein